MELKIDGQICDLKAGSIAVPGYDAARLADPEACREGRSLKIPIPATPRNDALVGFACDPHAAGGFNDALHTAELSAEGSVLIGGTVRLLAASGEGYTLEIRDGGAGWAENAARRMFSRLGVAWDNVLTPTAIVESWTDDSPVKFFPIHRDEYRRQNSSSDLLPAERLLSVEDYHPFLHVATLVGQIFREADYEVKSRFFESAFFRSLYMSGAYSSRDTTAAAGRMGFSARRLAPATAAANELGRVSANPKAVANTVGNIVDTATPQSVDADGEAIDGLFNNGNCFSTDNGKIVFTPPTEISVGFEYRLKYTTAHRIVSRTRLKGFDTVYLGPGAEFRFELANRYRDLREAVAPNFTYRALVFDHLAGAQYRLTYTRNGVPGTVWTDFAARSAQVTTPASGTVADPVLLVRSGSQWVAYRGDWALYNGYVGETGQTMVEVRLRTAAESVSPASPKYFNLIYFAGAEPGMALTLHKECSLRPRFLSAPGFGSRIAFADVAQHRIRQSELLDCPRASVQPAVLHRGGDAEGLDRAGRGVFRCGAGDGLERQDGLFAACRAAAGRPGDSRGADVAVPGRRRRGGALRRRGGGSARGVEFCGGFLRRDAGRKGAAQSAVQSLAECRGALPQCAVGADSRGRRPRRRGGGRNQLHAPHRPLRRDASAARRRAVGVSFGAFGVSARGVPFRGGRRCGGVHALFRGPRRTTGAAPLLRRAGAPEGLP